MYDQPKKRQQRLILILVALFIVVATRIGTLSNRYSSLLLTFSSVQLIAATVVCMILIGGSASGVRTVVLFTALSR
jgi:hypothetical protein